MNLEKIKEQYGMLRDVWSDVYDATVSSPSTYEPHIPEVSIHDLNDMVETLGFWLDRTRAPARMGRQFWLVSSALGSSLHSIHKTAKNLQSGQYGHFPTYVNQLSQVFGILHSMVALSRVEGITTASDLAGALAEAHVELQKVATALREKIELCEKADEWSNTLTEKVAEAKELVSDVREIHNLTEQKSTEFTEKIANALAVIENDTKVINAEVSEIRDEVKENARISSEKIEFTQEQIDIKLASIHDLLKVNQETQNKLIEQQVKLRELQQVSEQLKQQIEGLLPNAASAGLAHAFSARADVLEQEKNFWLKAFSGGLVSILVVAIFIYLFMPGIDFRDPQALLAGAFIRLPFLGPFIWFAWYSAVQYGNRVRVQEDYAFKKVTAQAFIGYRDHMEHLACVAGSQEGSTALTALATKTVDVLSNEPLRIYKDTHDEAAPITKIIGIVNRVVGGEKNNIRASASTDTYRHGIYP